MIEWKQLIEYEIYNLPLDYPPDPYQEEVVRGDKRSSRFMNSLIPWYPLDLYLGGATTGR